MRILAGPNELEKISCELLRSAQRLTDALDEHRYWTTQLSEALDSEPFCLHYVSNFSDCYNFAIKNIGTTEKICVELSKIADTIRRLPSQCHIVKYVLAADENMIYIFEEGLYRFGTRMLQGDDLRYTDEQTVVLSDEKWKEIDSVLSKATAFLQKECSLRGNPFGVNTNNGYSPVSKYILHVEYASGAFYKWSGVDISPFFVQEIIDVLKV